LAVLLLFGGIAMADLSGHFKDPALVTQKSHPGAHTIEDEIKKLDMRVTTIISLPSI
jgi:hypothetical protein